MFTLDNDSENFKLISQKLVCYFRDNFIKCQSLKYKTSYKTQARPRYSPNGLAGALFIYLNTSKMSSLFNVALI